MELFQELTMKIHFDFIQAIKKQEKKNQDSWKSEERLQGPE